ncbi:MAG: elongation factor P maturation arginine rhamnosyltransferase EarP [Rhodoferax sp.]|uniref:elongation factor P maturation arginine rhamnosyltransferase EarP n=1 Tax=Rhodoferax sp. TaxID=50421 RepID=UPI00271B35D8|nr:elongation factor P maturation arginine rhamnosyltransferase EarP [Rhodoferax sp.]MDO8450659.1 elongation factor P maturation arginine rhamnosyltransferase EarP [Rhodoferax sp.]
MKTGNLWDIFCKVIDNYGDIGVCWRLAVGLAARGERVRLWVDDASALRWMAPEGAQGVEVRPWTQPIQTDGLTVGDILVEAFGCEVAPEFIASYAYNKRATGQNAVWINLEYLSAEGFVERSHGLPSPVMSGPGIGLIKHFFYPGFTTGTGGLLRETDLTERQARFDRAAWLQQLDIGFQGERLISLFCYEPPALGALLDQLAADTQATRLLVTAGRATAAVKAGIKDKYRSRPSWNQRQALSFSYLPTLTQRDFDHLLWSCDLNFVRGEDSLVRALWAGKPFVWQIYPQHDDAHHSKLEAFLNVLHAPPSLRTFHHAWNGVSQAALPALAPSQWQETVSAIRTLQLQRDDLVTQIMRFALKTIKI